jgi:hypothetical protein
MASIEQSSSNRCDGYPYLDYYYGPFYCHEEIDEAKAMEGDSSIKRQRRSWKPEDNIDIEEAKLVNPS